MRARFTETMIYAMIILLNFADHAGAASPVLYENFEHAGTNWTNTIFTDVRPGNWGNAAFTASSLTSALGAPNVSPSLPINTGGDLEGRYAMTSPQQYGGVSGFALMPSQYQWTDMTMDGYIGFGRLTEYGSNSGSFILRSNNKSGYLATVNYGGSSYGSVSIQQMRDGLVHASYPAISSAPISINWNSSNIHLRVSAIGMEITAWAWTVSVLNGTIQETPVILNPSADNKYALTLTDDMYQTGTGGIHVFTARNNSIFFDDITVTPEPASLLLLALGGLVLRKKK